MDDEMKPPLEETATEKEETQSNSDDKHLDPGTESASIKMADENQTQPNTDDKQLDRSTESASIKIDDENKHFLQEADYSSKNETSLGSDEKQFSQTAENSCDINSNSIKIDQESSQSEQTADNMKQDERNFDLFKKIVSISHKKRSYRSQIHDEDAEDNHTEEKLESSKSKSKRTSTDNKKQKKASDKETKSEASISQSDIDTECNNEDAKMETENTKMTPDSENDSYHDAIESPVRLSSSSSSSDASDNEKEKETEAALTDDEIWLSKNTDSQSLPTWKSVEQMRKRELGCHSRSWQSKVSGSTAMLRRFEQQYTLDAHEGCVNALHFNQNGTLLASGSDDLDIHIWDWVSESQEPYISYNSGHRSNVFQAKFMPNSSDLTVISCARDGQVRMGSLSSTGQCRDTKKLAQHRGPAHKLALDSTGCKSTFLSCGEDSFVFGFDLRESKPTKLVSVKDGDHKIALYSIDSSPRQPQQFVVSGRDQWARIYDRRKLSFDNPEIVAKYCPHHLEDASDVKANITCLVYNYDGTELLCSYNDEDIYLFDTNHSSGAEFTRKYKGHRNNATVKGVNFYGPRSEFVVSGSDCGNLFLWDKASSQVVNFMQGDDGGVVNVLEPHPNLPFLATSGLDKNIKIWGPSGDGCIDGEKLKKLMLSNRKERHDESNESPVIDSHLLWILMRSLRNASGRRRHRREAEDDDDDDDSSNSSSSNSSSDSDRDEDGDGRRRRMECLTS